MEKETFTKEKLRKLYSNHFDLVNNAIRIARESVYLGTFTGLDNLLKQMERMAEKDLENKENV